VYICGLEISRENAKSLYSTLKLDKDKKNLVMLHGNVESAMGVDKVNVGKLADKNIDYLALGHIHSYSESKLDDRGRYAFSGCLEGRGFDETGEKGFVIVDTDDWNTEFVANSSRVIEEIRVDLTGTSDFYGAFQKCRQSVKCNGRDLLRINLVGEIDYDNATLAVDMRKNFENDYYFVSVKDRTVRRFDMEKIAADPSLKGEFIRTVLARSDFDDLFKQKVVDAGLKALSGREVD
jgi:DNA repair exonuclease SbcCD nuclease subunit